MTTAETRASCLDPEILAAWMDGTLSRDELASAEAHTATCARCQAMLAAMAKTTPVVVPPERSWRRFLIPVLVPVTALLAIAIWIARPPDHMNQPEPAGQMARLDESDKALRDQAESERRNEESRALQSSAPKAKEDSNANRQNLDAFAARPEAQSTARIETLRQRSAIPTADAPPPPPAAPAAPPAASGALQKSLTMAREEAAAQYVPTEGAAQSAGTAALDMIAPEPPRGWRLNNDRVERSIEGVWTVQYSEADTGLSALSSPSPDVCWVVGRAGIVIVTTDGRTWRKVPLPKTADLLSVLASDGENAVVFSADGAMWVTKNGGQSWEAPKR